jgi:hypothetical protein
MRRLPPDGIEKSETWILRSLALGIGGGFFSGVGCVDSWFDREVSLYIGMVLLALAAITWNSNLQEITKRARRDERLENGLATDSEVNHAALWLSRYPEGPCLVDQYVTRRSDGTEFEEEEL